jgi:hypothetical protein
MVSVRDTGIGIHPDQVEHIFDPYWKRDLACKDAPGSVSRSPAKSWKRTAAASG